MTPSVHISLKVRDLERSIEFYRRLFGPAAKTKPDYAKFVGREPEIHLALTPGLETAGPAGALSHLGIRVGTGGDVRRIKDEVRARGLSVEEEDPAACCYALQEKFWVTDPDGNRWEVYAVLADVEERDAAAAACCPR